MRRPSDGLLGLRAPSARLGSRPRLRQLTVLATVTESPWIRVPLVVFVVLAMQTSLFADIRPFGASADVMVLLAVAGGMVAGPQRGAVVGFGIGIAFDLVLATPFGLSALTYSLAAFAVGYLQTGMTKAPWWLTVLTVAGGCAGATVLYALLGALFGIEGTLDTHLITVVLVVAAVDALLATPAMWVMRWALPGNPGDR